MKNIHCFYRRRPSCSDRPCGPISAFAAQSQCKLGLMALAIGTSLTLGMGACANPPASIDRRAKTVGPAEPEAALAERAFPTAAIVIDDRSAPKKVWLMSLPANGAVQALEFFTGERVADVSFDPSNSAPPSKRMSYSFTDGSGLRYVSVRAVASAVDTDQPSAYAGWSGKDGRGHDVVLGATLFERKTVTGPRGVAKTVNTVIDPRPLFGEQSACEKEAYVARTQASTSQDSEAGFMPRAKILADYDTANRCWNTQPLHAVNLEDNTFLIATKTRVFRLSSKDLTPVGSAPNFRVVDIKE